MKNKTEFIKIAKKVFGELVEEGGGKGYRFDHHVRVMSSVEKFLRLKEFKGKVVNTRSLLIASLFHDIGIKRFMTNGKLYRYGQESTKEQEDLHSELGAELISQHISHLVSQKELKRTQEVIRAHEDYNTNDFEIQLLQDADNLDEVGYLDIWRMFVFAAFRNRTLEETIEFWFKEELPKKRKRLNRFHFPRIRNIAQKRIEKIDHFMNELKKETRGNDFS